MNEGYLQTGIDFGARWVDVCVLSATGAPLVAHQRFANSLPGYQQAKQLLLDTLAAQPEHGLNISGEATAMYWLPFFLQLAADPELAAYAPNLYLLNHPNPLVRRTMYALCHVFTFPNQHHQHHAHVFGDS